MKRTAPSGLATRTRREPQSATPVRFRSSIGFDSSSSEDSSPRRAPSSATTPGGAATSPQSSHKVESVAAAPFREAFPQGARRLGARTNRP